MDNHIFRGAALGFNRQDVMEYIEKVQKDAEARIADLTSQLDEARQAGDASRQELEECDRERVRLGDELAERKEQYEAELAELKERYEEAAAARDTAGKEAARQKERLQELEAENGRLAEQVRELTGRTEALRREKERLTQLELDAHSRSDELLARTQAQADAILAGASAEAADIRTEAQIQADELLAESRRQIEASAEKCGDLLRSCESVASRVSGELRKMEAAVVQLPAGMGHLKQSLAELVGTEKEK